MLYNSKHFLSPQSEDTLVIINYPSKDVYKRTLTPNLARSYL